MTGPGPGKNAGVADRGVRPFLNWKAVVGVTISLVLLWFTFRDIDLREVWHEITLAHTPTLLLATVLATVVFWIRAWRWRAILDPVHRGTSFASRFAAVAIGFAGNNLLPARVGEFARAYAIAKTEPVPMVAGLSSLVIERLFDAVLVVVLLFVAMAMPGFPPWPADAQTDFPGIAVVIGTLVAGVSVVLFLVVLWPRPTVRFFEAVAGRILPGPFRRPVVDALEAFLSGVGILRNGRLLTEAMAWSVFLWLVNAAGFWVAFRAFDIQLSFTAALFFQSCLAFVVSIPAAPGFWGTYEFAARIVLADLWGIEASRVLGFAVGYHLAGFVPITLIGLFYASRLGLSLSGMAQTEEVVEQAVEQAVEEATGGGRV